MDAVDGAVEKYIEYGFVEGVQQMYGKGDINIDVQIFCHDSPDNAKGIFKEYYPPSAEVISESEPEVVVDRSSMLNFTLYYVYETTFMRVVTYEKSDFALNTARQFYWNINRKISADE